MPLAEFQVRGSCEGCVSDKLHRPNQIDRQVRRLSGSPLTPRTQSFPVKHPARHRVRDTGYSTSTQAWASAPSLPLFLLFTAVILFASQLLGLRSHEQHGNVPSSGAWAHEATDHISSPRFAPVVSILPPT